MYPKDNDFEETIISKVDSANDGWTIERADGRSFFVPKQSVEPKIGMSARFYGKGIGYVARGLFIDGHEIFYRTEQDQKEKDRIDLYGKDSADWLKRWDLGKSVFSIAMGGMGPGYEQCIQITCAEILRELLDKKYDTEKVSAEDKDYTKFVNDHINAFSNDVVKKLRLSGAQWGAAKSLAWQIYSRGPIAVMEDPAVKDRHIQVSKNFPG